MITLLQNARFILKQLTKPRKSIGKLKLEEFITAPTVESPKHKLICPSDRVILTALLDSEIRFLHSRINWLIEVSNNPIEKERLEIINEHLRLSQK